MRYIKTGNWIVFSVTIGCLILINYIVEFVPYHFFRTTSEDNDFITVLCYNVKCKRKGYDRYQMKIADIVLRESPDVVFFCEFTKSDSKYLDSTMTMKGNFHRSYRTGANGVFYSKYEIDTLAAIDVGTSKGKFAINNMAHVSTPYGLITFLGCHLSSSRVDALGGFRERRREADSIYKVCMKEQRPLIVMGDLNDLSCSPSVNRIRGAGLKDAWWEGGNGYGSTYHDGWLLLRVDHILYDGDGLELIDVKVIDNNLSDHNALMAKFKIK